MDSGFSLKRIESLAKLKGGGVKSSKNDDEEEDELVEDGEEDGEETRRGRGEREPLLG